MTSLLETVELIVGRRWALIALLFALELAIIVAVSSSAFFPSELATYEKQYNSITPVLNQSATGQGLAIFANNLRVAVYELVPVIGLLLFGLSLYETARIVEVIAIVHKESVGLALGTLFFLPSTWLELPAYAIAAAESIYFLYALWRRARLVREIKFLIANVLLIIAVLAVAATFEVTEIQIEAAPAAIQPYVLLTWLPFFAIVAGVVAFWRKSRREAPGIEERELTEVAPPEPPQPVPVQEPSPPPASGDGGGAAT